MFSKNGFKIYFAIFVFYLYRRPCDFIIFTENLLKSALRQLKFPVEQRQKKKTESWDDLHKVETLLEKMKMEVNAKIGDLKMRFLSHLESKVVRESFHKLDILSLSVEEKAAFDAKNVAQFVAIRLGQIAEDFLDTSEFREWANTKLKKDVTEARRLLHTTSLRIHGPHAYKRSAVPSVVETIHAFATFEIAMGTGAVASAITGMLIGQFVFEAGVSITIVGSATVIGALVAFPIGLALGAVGAAAILATRIQLKKKKVEAFQKNVKEVYDKRITNKDKHLTFVNNLISTLAKCRCPLVEDLLDTLPQMHDQLHKTLLGIEKAKEENCPKYKELLSKFQNLNGKVSILTLQCMPHKFTSNDILWPQSNPPVGSGSFADVYKLTIPGEGKVALKVIKHDITQGNTASEVKNEFEVCRYQL